MRKHPGFVQSALDRLRWYGISCVWSEQRQAIRCVHVRTLGDYGKVVRRIVDVKPTTHGLIQFLWM